MPLNSNWASTTRRAYNSVGRVISEVRGHGSANVTTSFTYDALGNLTSVTDPLNHVTTRTYDQMGRVVKIEVPVDGTPANNLVTEYAYNAFGNVAKIDGRARLQSPINYYDALGRLWLQSDNEQFLTQTVYNNFGEVHQLIRRAVRGTGTRTITQLPTIVTTGADAVTTFAYDKLGRVTSVTDAETKTESYQYNTFGDRTQVTNKASGITQYGYDKRGLMYYELVDTIAYRANGGVQSSGYYNAILEYDARGNLTHKIEANGLDERRDTYFVYDRADRLTKTTHEAVQVFDADLIASTVTPEETFTYNPRGELVRSVDATGGKTTIYYDVLGRKSLEIDAAGTARSWLYDAAGNLERARVYETALAIPSDPLAAAPTPTGAYRETVYGYDWAGRRLTETVSGLQFGALIGSNYSTTLSGSTAVTSLYDKAGNRIAQADGLGNVARTWFDGLGREIAQVDREGYLTVWTRNSNGNAALYDSNNNGSLADEPPAETRYATRITATVTESTTVAQLKTLAGTSAADRITNFTYDRNGRRLTETRLGVEAWTVSSTGALSAASSSSATIVYVYNELGLVTSKTAANGDVTNYVYDSAGRLQTMLEAAHLDQTGASVRRMTKNYYDGLGNLVRATVNSEAGSSADDRVTQLRLRRRRAARADDRRCELEPKLRLRPRRPRGEGGVAAHQGGRDHPGHRGDALSLRYRRPADHPGRGALERLRLGLRRRHPNPLQRLRRGDRARDHRGPERHRGLSGNVRLRFGRAAVALERGRRVDEAAISTTSPATARSPSPRPARTSPPSCQRQSAGLDHQQRRHQYRQCGHHDRGLRQTRPAEGNARALAPALRRHHPDAHLLAHLQCLWRGHGRDRRARLHDRLQLQRDGPPHQEGEPQRLLDLRERRRPPARARPRPIITTFPAAWSACATPTSRAPASTASPSCCSPAPAMTAARPRSPPGSTPRATSSAPSTTRSATRGSCATSSIPAPIPPTRTRPTATTSLAGW